MVTRESLSTVRVRRLSDLERVAFPDHEISLPELRRVAYRLKSGKGYPPNLADHLEGCPTCQRELRILTQIDPLLTGEDDRQFEVFIEAVKDPLRAREIEQQARKAVMRFFEVRSRAMGIASAAAAFVATLLSESRGAEKQSAMQSRKKTKYEEKRTAAYR